MNITLALGGGGVRGFAHIGSLKVMEAEGFHIRGVAGTSAGGLVAALYASGYSPLQIEKRILDLDQGRLFARMHGDGPSLLGLAGVAEILTELVGDRTFSETSIPLAITATDLTSGIPVVLRHGRIVDAALATSAVPGIFPPISMDGHLFVDGGVTNPIPIAEARALSPGTPVIAIILSPPLGWKKDLGPDSLENIPITLANIPLLYKLAGKLRLAQAFNVFIQSMDVGSLILVDKQVQLEKPDVIIRPELSRIASISRVDIPRVIELGEVATRKALPEIHKVVSWQSKLKRRLDRFISTG